MIQLTNPFQQVGFESVDLSLTLTTDDNEEQAASLRMLVVTDLETLINEAIDLAQWFVEHGEKEASEFYAFCLQMLPFAGYRSRIDPSHERRFDAETFNKLPEFREMTAMTGSLQMTHAERLKRFVSSDLHFHACSFETAKFSKPEIAVPFDRVQYVQFRDELLEEMVEIRAELEKSADETARTEAKQLLRSSNIDAKQKAKARKILGSDDVFEVCPSLYDAMDRIEQMLMKTALRLESERTKPYEHLIESVESILLSASELAAAENPPCEDFVDIDDDQLLRFLDVSQAVMVIGQIIATEEKHPGSMGREAKELMSEAIDGKNPVDLWEALTWFRENMVNRNECIRLMMREAELILHFLVETALTERFVKIRKELSIQERRLFHFMYRRSPWFKDRIPALDSMGRGFLFGFDNEHLSLVLGVATYRGTAEQAKEIETRWKAFVTLYPFWIEVVRSHDRHRKSQLKSMPPKIEDEIVGYDPRELVDASIEPVSVLAEKYCTPNQGRVITAHFIDDRTQGEIAQEFGVSQQAISKTIRKALSLIREGLARDMMISTEKPNRRSK